MRAPLQASAMFVLLCTVTLAEADPPREKKLDEPADLLQVDTVCLVRVNGTLVSFNEGRQYAISINEHLNRSKPSRAILADTLKKQNNLDQIVFEWFGDKPPKQLNLLIGDEVPIPIVQAVIAAYAADAKIPVCIVLAVKDEGLGRKRCISVGSYLDGKGRVTTEKIRELLKPGLTSERLAELLR